MRVEETQEFGKQKIKLSKVQQKKIGNCMRKLADSKNIGDVLGPSWLREIRLHYRRAYFFVRYEVALFVALSTKKNQQAVIDELRENLDAWDELLKKLSEHE